MPRAFPNAPNGYVPTQVSCPANRPMVRNATSLSSNETSWLEVRRNNTIPAMRDFFKRINLGNFDPVLYLDQISNNASALPNIGIAVSGGGYRAMLSGAGAIKAFDNRTENATGSGQLGGLFQSATYLSGLSGGSWLVGSIYMNNFSTISTMQTYQPGYIWQFGNSILIGPAEGGIQILNSAKYYTDLANMVGDKKAAGFETTITDYW